MKLRSITYHNRNRIAVARAAGTPAFTLIEVMVTVFLMVILITATLGSIASMQVSASRVRDYNSTMAVLEAKINDVRAVYYNPPNYPFTTNTVLLTNQYSVDLNSAGTQFLVPGSLVTKIQYLGSMGHLVTVTATSQASVGSLNAGSQNVSMQTVVNKYSGGQQ